MCHGGIEGETFETLAFDPGQGERIQNLDVERCDDRCRCGPARIWWCDRNLLLPRWQDRYCHSLDSSLTSDTTSPGYCITLQNLENWYNFWVTGTFTSFGLVGVHAEHIEPEVQTSFCERCFHHCSFKLSQRHLLGYTPNAVVELLPHSHCVGANLTAP